MAGLSVKAEASHHIPSLYAELLISESSEMGLRTAALGLFPGSSQSGISVPLTSPASIQFCPKAQEVITANHLLCCAHCLSACLMSSCLQFLPRAQLKGM